VAADLSSVPRLEIIGIKTSVAESTRVRPHKLNLKGVMK
jgi:hypothetical protein